MSDRYSLILCNQFLKQTGLQVYIGDPTLWNPGMITAPEEIEYVLDSIPSDYLTPTDHFDPQLVTLAPELSFAQRSAIISLLTSASISSVFSKFLPAGGIKGAPPFSIELLLALSLLVVTRVVCLRHFKSTSTARSKSFWIWVSSVLVLRRLVVLYTLLTQMLQIVVW